MTREELLEKPRTELLKMPEAKCIKGKSNMSKSELAYAIWEHMQHITLMEKSEESLRIQNYTTTSPMPQWQQETRNFEENAFTPRDAEHSIPNQYNTNKLIIMARDPYWLFAYWEISDYKRLQLYERYPGWDGMPLLIRVYDVTDVHFNGKNAHRYFEIQVNHQAKSWYIYVGEADRSFCCELGFFYGSGEFIPIVRSNTTSTPRDRISHVIDEEWMIVEEDFQKLFRVAGGMNIGLSSLELMERFRQRIEHEISSGTVSSLSSPGKWTGFAKERKFWLVVHTELIVYGATEPGASVTVQGRSVQLREDGTFTMRFALPDGQQYIPVTAESPDHIDTLTITPIVTKSTI